MKNIKLNIFQLVLLCTIVLAGCKKDDIILEEASHRVIFTSEMDFLNTIEVNGTISFGDVSSGVESRTWTFPEGVVDIVDADNDVTSSEARVTTIFTKAGVYDVHLSQVFTKEAYTEFGLSSRELDTTIVVTVLDEIEVSIQANYLNDDGTLGAALNIADMANNPIPASKSVHFSFTGLGEPANITWYFEGGSPEFYTGRELELDVKYKFLGTFDLTIIAGRSRPFGRDTLQITDFIEVQPSTDPVVVDRVSERNGNIAVEFNREIDETTLNGGDFSVTIQNDFVAMPTFTASIDPNEGNVVLLTLDNESIYNDDTIKVTYTQGTLYSLDGIQADAFTDEIVEFDKINILATNSMVDWSFENGTDLNWPSLGWAPPFDYYDIKITTDQAYDGDKSMEINLDATRSMAIGHVDNNGANVTFPVNTSKTYEMGVWVYAETLGDPTIGLEPDLRLYWGPDTDWGIVGTPTFTDQFPLNEWVYAKTFVTFPAATGPQTFWIRGFNGSNPQAIKYYIDGISLAEVTLRP